MGKYDNFWDNQQLGNTPAPAKGAATSATVSKALATTQNALLRSPEIAKAGKYDQFWDEAQDIASGKPKEQGGILGAVTGAVVGVGKLGLDALAVPEQIVASGLKELSDVSKGDASVKDFFKQATTKGYRMSTWNSANTGVKWLDTALNLGQDIITDPLMWTGFGAAGLAGKGGRTGLAVLAGETNAARVAKGLPELFTAKDINQLGRLGQYATLNKEQQAALNIQRGLRYQFGAQNLVFKPETVAGKVSAETAKVIGGGVSRGRAMLGDVILNNRVANMVTPKSMRILGNLGRKGSDVNNVLQRVAAHSSGTYERTAQQLFYELEAGKGKVLADEILNSPYRATVYQVMDGTRAATDPAEQALADALAMYRDSTHATANDVVREFNMRRGANASTINKIDNYGVPRSLTDEAGRWVNSPEGAASKSASQIAGLTDLTKQEFIGGPTITRMRTLGVRDDAGNLIQDTFLGVKLVDGSIDDVNRISEEVLGFKWFETDAAKLMQDYTQSASKFAGRVAFVDRMLDFGPQVIDRMLYKIIPTDGIEDVRKAIMAQGAARQGISDALDVLDAKGLSILDGTLANAERELAAGVARRPEIMSARRSIQRKIKTVDAAIARAEARAAGTTGAIRESYEVILGPLRDRADALRAAMSSEQQIIEASIDVLAPIHMKLLPNTPVPTTVDEIVANIRNFNETRVANVAKDVAEGKVPKTVLTSLKGQNTKTEKLITKTIDDATDAISGLTLPQAKATSPINWEGLADVPEELEGYLGTEAIQSLEDWILEVKYPKKWLDEVAGPDFQFDEHYQVLQERLKDAGVPEVVTITRQGTPVAKGNVRNGSAIDGWVGGGDNKYGYGVDKKIFVSDVPRENIVGFGQMEEGEIFYRTEGVTTREYASAKEYKASADYKAGDAQPYDYGVAINELQKTSKEIAGLEKKLADEISAETSKFTEKPLQKRTELVTALDNNTAMKLEQDQWEKTVRPQLEASIDELRTIKGTADVATMKFNEVSAETFDEAIGKARAKIKNGRPVGLTVYQYPLEEYKTMRTFLSEDGLTGYAIKADGDFVSLFNVGAKGAGEQAILDGIWVNGALKLDAFAQVTDDYPKGFLNTKYEDFGFEEVSRDKWDAQYAPDGWDEGIDGTPDVVYMKVKEGTLRNVESTTRTSGTKSSASTSTVSGTAPTTGKGLPDGVQGRVGTGTTDATVPSTGAKGRRIADQYTSEWLNRTDKIFAQINDPNILDDAQRQAWDKVVTLNQAGEKSLAEVEGKLGFNTQINQLLSPPSGSFYYDELPPSFYGNIVKDVRDGWVAIENLGVQMPKELSDMLFSKIDTLGTKAGQNKFFQFFRQWNQFFRVTAMLSPGFIVRNAYTGAFNNFVAGGTIEDTVQAIRFATVLQRRGLDAALDSIPEMARADVELAYRGVIASGGGQTLDIIQPMVDTAKTNRLMNNRVVKAWSTSNENLEIGLRMSMALRGVKNGLDLDQIGAMVTRYHFNYQDLSKLDEYAKLFVPFWTFASKNIGLQFANQFSRPSMYLGYEKLKDSMPVDENLILPEWLARREPLGLTSGVVLNPDLPQVDMADQLRNFSDPLRLLGQAYPQYRLIPELAGNRMFNTGIPFSQKLQPVRGPADYPSALLGMLTGQTVDTPEGKALTAKGAYVLPQAIPLLGTLQRLLPSLGGQAKYAERQGSSWAGFLGAPIRGVSAEEQERTLTGREIALQKLIDDLQRRGYVGQ